ncbi:rod shape-determining protein MreC [Anaplasma marginale]|uniref:rod shape-determining protein MreC n=1 Tax=Anaplasma marginale TaxID=770 RepID=UPI0002FB33BB|nr:rod shape-determining protein MreC [Anaplasma marginale]
MLLTFDEGHVLHFALQCVEIKRGSELLKNLKIKSAGPARVKSALLIFCGIVLYCTYPLYETNIVRLRAETADLCVSVAKKVQDVLKWNRSADIIVCDGGITQDEAADSGGVLVKILAKENDHLKQMLNFLSHHADISYVTTRAVVVYDGTREHVFLPIGRREGIRDQQAVVTSQGLIGKTTDVGEHSARVLLIASKDFRIPVMVVESGVNAILAGSAEGLVLTHLSSSNTELHDGDLVITTGNDEGFPHGIYVGHILAQNKVVTSVNLREIGVVSVMSAKHMHGESID